MLESNDHCFVNMVNGQLDEGRSTRVMSDKRLADVENWSWERNTNEEGEVETSAIESYEFSDDEHEKHVRIMFMIRLMTDMTFMKID